VQSSNSNTIALTNFLGESSNRSDVSIYLQSFRPEAVDAAKAFTVQIIANGVDQQNPENSTQLKAGTDTEGNLDAETIIGLTWPTPLIEYNTGGSPPFVHDAFTVSDTNEPYLTWLQHIIAEPNLPQVISSSYGDDEQSVPLSYATSVCNLFAQLGARGVSVLFASGDHGVGIDGFCISNDGKNTPTFLPSFPASCVSC
jgi:tripeptidyl-peptidase-1